MCAYGIEALIVCVCVCKHMQNRVVHVFVHVAV